MVAASEREEREEEEAAPVAVQPPAGPSFGAPKVSRRARNKTSERASEAENKRRK